MHIMQCPSLALQACCKLGQRTSMSTSGLTSLKRSEGRSNVHIMQCPSLALQACCKLGQRTSTSTSGLTSLKRKRRTFECAYHAMPFACASGLLQTGATDLHEHVRAYKPEAQAKDVRMCISCNALRLRFRLVASWGNGPPRARPDCQWMSKCWRSCERAGLIPVLDMRMNVTNSTTSATWPKSASICSSAAGSGRPSR